MDKRSSKKLKRNSKLMSKYLSSSDSETEAKKNKKRRTKKRKTKEKQIWEMSPTEVKAMWKKQEENHRKNRELLKLAEEFKERIKEDIKKEEEWEKEEKEKEERRKNFVMKDCKHYSKEQLTEMFERDFKWINDTFRGKRYCERHELFKKDHPKYRYTARDLNYNVSCEVFTEEQQIYLIGLFRKTYDEGNIYKHIDYYWKVLLPEYCLKLFMECYELRREEALQYLNSIPVPIEKYFNTLI